METIAAELHATVLDPAPEAIVAGDEALEGLAILVVDRALRAVEPAADIARRAVIVLQALRAPRVTALAHLRLIQLVLLLALALRIAEALANDVILEEGHVDLRA